MLNPFVLIAFGIFVGAFSGLMGLGGGSVMIPIMVLLLGMSQPQAHGVSLAVMIPPVTIPAVMKYYQDKAITRADLLVALLIAIGFGCGSYFGAKLATSIPKEELKLVFGFFLVYVACYTIFSFFGKEHLLRTVLLALVVTVFTVGVFLATKWMDGAARTQTATSQAGLKSQI